MVNPCSDTPAQQVVAGDDGRIRSALDETKCLTLFGEAFEAGNRAPGEPWYRRLLTFSTCADAKHSSTIACPARQTMPYGSPHSVDVRVVGGRPTPTGTIHLLTAGTTIGQANLNSTGRATVVIPGTALLPGLYDVDVLYSGDDRHVSSADSLKLKVTKGR